MSHIEDELETDVNAGSNGQSSELSDELVQAQSPKPLVITTWKHYKLRFISALMDWFLIGFLYLPCYLVVGPVVAGIEHLIFHPSGRLALYLSLTIAPVCLSVCVFWVKWWSSYDDWSHNDLTVVTKDGRRLSLGHAALRALACSLTWYLIPVHLACMAVGSRRLIHDVMSRTYVIIDGELTGKVFYPPMPRWIGVAYGVVCVLSAIYIADAGPAIKDLEREAVAVLLGPESRQYLDYLQWRYEGQLPKVVFGITRREERFWPSFQKFAGVEQYAGGDAHTFYGQMDDARRLLPVYQKMVQLEKKYSGADSVKSLQIIYETAYLASIAQKRDSVDKYLSEFLNHCDSVCRSALGPSVSAGSENCDSPKLMAAPIYYRVSLYDKAISLVVSEKAKAIENSDRLKIARCSELLVELYSAKLNNGEHDQDYEKMIKEEQLNLKAAE